MTKGMRAQAGDLIEIHGPRLGAHNRIGEILEVIGAGDHEHYRVRWDDGRESIFTPAGDAVIRHGRQVDREPDLAHGRT